MTAADGSQVIETAAGPVQIVDSGGDGPAVLFVHGSPGGCDQGALMGGFLSDAGFRVVAPSRPGYLDTPLTDTTRTPVEQAELLAAAMDVLGIGSYGLMCWSGGGPSSYHLARLRPGQVRALVAAAAVSSPYRFAHPSEEKAMFTRPGAWLMQEMARRAPKRTVAMMVTEEGDLPKEQAKALVEATWDDEARRAFVLGWVDTVVGHRQPGFDNDRDQLSSVDLQLEDVCVPALLVHATTDADVPVEHSRQAAERLPEATLLTIEDGTHISVWAGPDESATQARIVEFLRP